MDIRPKPLSGNIHNKCSIFVAILMKKRLISRIGCLFHAFLSKLYHDRVIW